MFEESLTKLTFPKLFKDFYMSTASVRFGGFWTKFSSVFSCNLKSLNKFWKLKIEFS